MQRNRKIWRKIYKTRLSTDTDVRISRQWQQTNYNFTQYVSNVRDTEDMRKGPNKLLMIKATLYEMKNNTGLDEQQIEHCKRNDW